MKLKFTYSGGGAVVQCGVAAPSETLIWREFARALAFEEEDAFAEGIVVVVRAGDWLEGKEQEENGEDANC